MAPVYDIDTVNAYIQRNELLLELGFISYRQYLRSALWKGIRANKLKRDTKCYGCSKRAQQVHHGSYSLVSLTGKSAKDLWSVCKRCHQWIEFTKDGYKRDPKEATDELKRIHRIYWPKHRNRIDRRPIMIIKPIA